MVAFASTHRHVLMVKKQCFGNISGPEWKCPCWVPRKCLCWWTGTLVPRPFLAFRYSEVWASLFLKQLFLPCTDLISAILRVGTQLASPVLTFQWIAHFFPALLFRFSDWPKMGADVVNTCWKSLNIIFTLEKSLTQAVSDCVNSWLHSGLLTLLLLPEITDSRERPWEVNHRLT